MGIIDETTQKIKGETQNISADIKDASGDHIGAASDRIKGNYNKTSAHIKETVRRNTDGNPHNNAER